MAWENSLSCLAECNQAVVESAVEGLFSILLDRPGESREWARDFIFDYDSDSAGDTMALSNDAVAAYTSGSRVSVAGMRGNGEACELFSVQVPVWCQNGLVVGINVWHTKGTPFLAVATPGQCDFHEAVGRFVQDRHGETIVINSLSGVRGSSRCEYVAVTHFASPTSTTRYSSYVICDPNEISKRPKSPSSFALASVSYCFSPGERSFCPVCFQSPSRLSPCSCQLPFKIISGALDFGRFFSNASIFNTGTSRNKLELFERESCDRAFARRILPSLISTRNAFGAGSGQSLCDILRALGIRYCMSLGVVPARLPLKVCRDPLPDSEQQESTHLTVHNTSQAFSVVPSERARKNSAAPVEGRSLSVDAIQGVEQFKTLVDDPFGNCHPITLSSEIEIMETHEGSPSVSHFGGQLDLARECADAGEAIRPALDSGKEGFPNLEMQRRRIERNRISAARYNLRKREERENLRGSINQWRAKENELKERESEYVLALLQLVSSNA